MTWQHALRAITTACAVASVAFRTAPASAQPTPVMVDDLVHGVNGSNPTALASANGRLVFGPRLGFSDGTPAGTEWPAACAVDIWSPLEAGGLVYFVANNNFPYRTDGTCNGTLQLANDRILAVPVNPGRGLFAAVGPHVLFFGSHGLWRTDGTPEGTTLVRAFGVAQGAVAFAAAGQTRLYFETDAADGTATVWVSDGTTLGTVPVASFVDGANGVWATRRFTSFAAVGDRLFFAMYSSAEGVELWTSDGTPGGTALVTDLQPGTASSDPVGFVAFQGRLAFAAQALGSLVYLSDGTAVGTTLVHPSFSAPGSYIWPPLFTVGGRLLGTSGTTLSAWDGTPGASPVVLGPGVRSFPVIAGNVAYYSADDVLHGYELWQTDGTPAGTQLAAGDLCPGACSGFQQFEADPILAVVGGAIFFRGNDGVHGAELWRIGLPTPGPLPSARSDTYAVSAGATLTVPSSGVLANDEDNGTGALTAALVTSPGVGALTLGADGGFTFAAPATPGTVTFTYRALNANATSAPGRVTITVLPVPPVAAEDQYATSFDTTLTVGAPGVLANDSAPGATVTVDTSVVHGSLTLAPTGGFTYEPPAGFVGTTSFTYRATSVGGSSTATVTIVVGTPTTVQPPTTLVVTSVIGNVVTLQWTPPALGPTPTGWEFEGGVDPGQPLVTMPTGDVAPAFTFTAPAGSYYVRVRAVDGATRSAPSVEVRVFIAQPVPPAAPGGLVGLAHGSRLALRWQPSFARGEVSSFVLDVTGAATTTLPVGAADTFAFDGVPAGTYTFAVRALNTHGSSPASNPVTLTFPSACSGVPDTPTNIVAYTNGPEVHLRWDSAGSGAAPASFVLQVTGAFTGTIPVTARSFSTAAPPGTYAIAVAAANACGSSAPSATRTVTVP